MRHDDPPASVFWSLHCTVRGYGRLSTSMRWMLIDEAKRAKFLAPIRLPGNLWSFGHTATGNLQEHSALFGALCERMCGAGSGGACKGGISAMIPDLS